MNAAPRKRISHRPVDIEWEREREQQRLQMIAELKQQRHWMYRYTQGGMTAGGYGITHGLTRDAAIRSLQSLGFASSIDFNSLREISYEQMREKLCDTHEW